jgi:hypothetical protein
MKVLCLENFVFNRMYPYYIKNQLEHNYLFPHSSIFKTYYENKFGKKIYTIYILNNQFSGL